MVERGEGLRVVPGRYRLEEIAGLHPDLTRGHNHASWRATHKRRDAHRANRDKLPHTSDELTEEAVHRPARNQPAYRSPQLFTLHPVQDEYLSSLSALTQLDGMILDGANNGTSIFKAACQPDILQVNGEGGSPGLIIEFHSNQSKLNEPIPNNNVVRLLSPACPAPLKASSIKVKRSEGAVRGQPSHFSSVSHFSVHRGIGHERQKGI